MDNKHTPALELLIANSAESFTSDRDYITIGRDSSCDLSFPEMASLSRRHAVICFKNGAWYVVDLHSSNGTWLNKERLVPSVDYALQPGDLIVLPQNFKILFLRGDVPSVRGIPLPPQPLIPPAPPVQSDGTFCRMCGSRVTSRFCTRCGAVQDTATASAPMHSAPPPAPSMAPMAPPMVSPAPMHSAPPPAPSMAPPMVSPAPMRSAPPPAPSMAPSMAPAAPAKQQKKSIFGSLFGGRAQKTKEKEQPAPVQTDDIQFRAAAPAALNPGEYFTVKIMMYREDDYERADREQKSVADRVKAATSGVFQAKREEKFRICLQSPDIPVDTDSAELIWNGKYASADMDVLLPEDYRGKQLRLTGRVYSGIAVITDLKLILQVDAPQQQEVRFEKCSLRTAFISYASQDRAKVVARIQGIQLSRPDMDLFFDAESLRRGEQWEQRLYSEIEKRDIFYLFWSRNAANSQWVAKELAYAILKKGPTAVEPVPLEDPVVCPPPQSLQDRHFNDWTLRYLDR